MADVHSTTLQSKMFMVLDSLQKKSYLCGLEEYLPMCSVVTFRKDMLLSLFYFCYAVRYIVKGETDVGEQPFPTSSAVVPFPSQLCTGQGLFCRPGWGCRTWCHFPMSVVMVSRGGGNAGWPLSLGSLGSLLGNSGGA